MSDFDENGIYQKKEITYLNLSGKRISKQFENYSKSITEGCLVAHLVKHPVCAFGLSQSQGSEIKP